MVQRTSDPFAVTFDTEPLDMYEAFKQRFSEYFSRGTNSIPMLGPYGIVEWEKDYRKRHPK
jgi:hypothetical protein